MSNALKCAAAGAGDAGQITVEDAFATSLYTGTGATQTITNGIDLAGHGGLVWTKSRSLVADHYLVDSERATFGAPLQSNTTNPQSSGISFTANSNGYAIGAFDPTGASGETYVSWTFRKAPKFFDVVTFTTTASNNQSVPHSLGVTPGFIVVKNTQSADGWKCYHRSTGRNRAHFLNGGGAIATDYWGQADPTTSDFRLNSSGFFAVGETHVAYVFAHDTDTVDGFIQCGAFTTDGAGAATVSLGWEPQFLLHLDYTNVANWYMLDTTRGWTSGSTSKVIYPNSSGAELTGNGGNPQTSGFFVNDLFASSPHIYIAIRKP